MARNANRPTRAQRGSKRVAKTAARPKEQGDSSPTGSAETYVLTMWPQDLLGPNAGSATGSELAAAMELCQSMADIGALLWSAARFDSVELLEQAFVQADSMAIDPFALPFPFLSAAGNGNIAQLVLAKGAPAVFDRILEWASKRAGSDLLPLWLSFDALCDRIELRRLGPADDAYEVEAFRRVVFFSLRRGHNVPRPASPGYAWEMFEHFLLEVAARAEETALAAETPKSATAPPLRSTTARL